MLDGERRTRSTHLDITELRATSSRNRHRFIADPKSCEKAIADLSQEYLQHSWQELEAMFEDYAQIVYPYLFRAAETGATFFPIGQFREGFLRPDRVTPLVCTRSDLLACTPSGLFQLVCHEWDYYRAQGLDNAIVRTDDGFTWFLTW